MPSSRNLIEFDQLPFVSGHRKQTLVQYADVTKSAHFSNWAGGNDFISCASVNGSHPSQRRQLCQPIELSSGNGAAMNGHRQRVGTWVTSPDVNRRCDENENHSICGFYREFDTGTEAATRTLAQQISPDMSRFRDLRQGG